MFYIVSSFLGKHLHYQARKPICDRWPPQCFNNFWSPGPPAKQRDSSGWFRLLWTATLGPNESAAKSHGGQVDQETKIVPHKEVYLPPRIIDIHQNKLTQWIFVAFGLGLTDSRELKVKMKFLKHPTRPSTSGHFEKEICRSQRQRPPRRHRPWQKRLRHHRGRWQKMTMLRQRLGNKRVTSSSSSLT